jgi:hypothetical protein
LERFDSPAARELQRKARREFREAGKWRKQNNSVKAGAHIRGAIRFAERAREAERDYRRRRGLA